MLPPGVLRGHDFLADRRRRFALLLPESMAGDVEPVRPIGIGMPMRRRVGRIDLQSARLAWLPASHRRGDRHAAVMLEVSQCKLESDAFPDALLVHDDPFHFGVAAGPMPPTRDI